MAHATIDTAGQRMANYQIYPQGSTKISAESPIEFAISFLPIKQVHDRENHPTSIMYRYYRSLPHPTFLTKRSAHTFDGYREGIEIHHADFNVSGKSRGQRWGSRPIRCVHGYHHPDTVPGSGGGGRPMIWGWRVTGNLRCTAMGWSIEDNEHIQIGGTGHPASGIYSQVIWKSQKAVLNFATGSFCQGNHHSFVRRKPHVRSLESRAEVQPYDCKR